MNRRRLLARTAAAAALAACTPFQSHPIGTIGGSRADRMLAGMSPAARAGQLMSVAFRGTKITPALEAMIRGRSVGGVILYAENFDGDAARLKALIADLSRIAAEATVVPLFFSIDQEGGAVVRIGRGATILPGNMALAATPDPADSVRKAVAITARDLRALGVNFELAPDADVNNEPRNPIILNRSFGSDPQRVASLVTVATNAFADAKLLCCVKHFPGHGATTTDSHTGLPLLDVDRARLDAVELVPFRAAIAAGTPAIMSAHIRIPALDPTPDVPVTLSRRVMTGLIRTELGFGGLLVTDDLEMGALTQTRSESQAGYDAFLAGADLLLFRFDESAQTDAHDRLTRSITTDQTALTRSGDSVGRILAVKERFGILDASAPSGTAGSDADRATADELARASITVLRAGGLPLRGRIFAVSPLDPDIALVADQPSLGQVLAQRLPNVTTQTITLSPSRSDIDRAVASARAADVVVLGAADLFSYPQQATLARALQAVKPTVLVSLRSPYDILSAPSVAGYVCAYTGREPTLRALAGVLSGSRAPTGTLPVDVPGAYRIGDGMKRL
ncbi:MAG TPA: glycoside hydrolase family 3 N-terminal domain-containing protein [Candidatus Limnocylindria bacterium]|nr:glycoside hydrolase family 3 N-terminal domain-containing protein [Candidatus Limnocylindria bacterium]